jgi:iron complex outermembrane receptor protein
MRTVLNRRIHTGNWLFRLTVGADLEVQNDTRKEFENPGLPEDQVDMEDKSNLFELLQNGPLLQDQDESVLGIGPFAEVEFSISPKWLLTVGGRYDRYRFEATDHYLEDGCDDSGTITMERYSPKVGLIYRPHNFIKFYGHYSTAFQTPTITELSNLPTGEGGINPHLKPEIMHSYEIGMKGMWPVGIKGWLARRLDYDVSFYVLTVEDMLIPFQIEDPARESTFFRNAGKSQNKGAELKFDWFPVEGLRASFAYSFMDFVFKDFMVKTSVDDTTQLVQLSGNEVPGVPPHQIFTGITYQHPIGIYSEVNLRWVDQYFTSDFNGPPPGSDKPLEDFVNDAYTVADVRLGSQRMFWHIGIEIFLGINNLFDKRYNGSIVPNEARDRFFEPAPGRNWYAGISLSLAGGAVQQ